MAEERSEPAVRVPEGSCSGDDSTNGPPFAAEPRPSIGYLLVWATCVAVYASVYRTLSLSSGDSPAIGARTAFDVLWTIIAGTYLAGLVLMVSRRRHHCPFPRSGGEMIWIFGGLGIVESLFIFGWSELAFSQGYYYNWQTSLAVLFEVTLWLPLLIYSIGKYSGHWQGYFVVRLVLEVFKFLPSFRPRVLYVHPFLFKVRILLDLIVLLGVALLDLRRRQRRYPWPHWFGIALDLAALAIAMLLLTLR